MENATNNTEVHKGLEGVIAASTKIGYVDGQAGMLNYRGYDIKTLAEQSNYEEVSFLLLYGHLPTREEYNAYATKLRELSKPDEDVYDVIRKIGAKFGTNS